MGFLEEDGKKDRGELAGLIRQLQAAAFEENRMKSEIKVTVPGPKFFGFWNFEKGGEHTIPREIYLMCDRVAPGVVVPVEEPQADSTAAQASAGGETAGTTTSGDEGKKPVGGAPKAVDLNKIEGGAKGDKKT